MGRVGGWAIGAHASNCAVNPWLQAKAVVQEHISIAQTSEVLDGWFVIVNGDVHGAHHLDFDQTAGDGGSELLNVIG